MATRFGEYFKDDDSNKAYDYNNHINNNNNNNNGYYNMNGYLLQAEYDRSTKPKTLLNYENVFSRVKTLGVGGYGEVWLVIDKYGQEYALKTTTDLDPLILEQEVNLLRKLSSIPNCNPNISCYYDSFIFNYRGKSTYGILMQYIPGVTLAEYKIDKILNKEYNSLIELAANVGVWLTNIILNLHHSGYVHRDIKAANIMVMNNQNNYQNNNEDNYKFVLLDFGISCDVVGNLHGMKINECDDIVKGTTNHMAPELLNRSFKKDLVKYYKSADVYACGIVLFNLIYNSYPYTVTYDEENSSSKFTKNVIYNKPKMTKQLKCLNNVIFKMITLNPNNRISIEDAHQALLECL